MLFLFHFIKRETTAQLPSSHPRSRNRRKFLQALCVCMGAHWCPVQGGRAGQWWKEVCVASRASWFPGFSLISLCCHHLLGRLSAFSLIGFSALCPSLLSFPDSLCFLYFYCFGYKNKRHLTVMIMLTEWFKSVDDLKIKGLKKKVINKVKCF